MKNTTPKGLLRGDRFNQSHSTVIKGAEPFIRFLGKCPGVKKVTIGVITPAQCRKPSIRVKETHFSLEAVVKTNTCIQQFYIHCHDKQQVIQSIEDWKLTSEGK